MSGDRAPDLLDVVLDSNVIVSAFAFPGGIPYQLLQAVLRDELSVTLSPHILTEVEGVLRGKLAVAGSTVDAALILLRDRCTIIEPPRAASVMALTDADNRVLDCAVASGAAYLCTGDRALQQVGAHEGVEIISPAVLLELVVGRRGQA